MVLSALDFMLTIGMLSCWAIAGTLARVGLHWISDATISTLAPSDSPIGPDILANILGCFAIGALSRYNALSKRYTLEVLTISD